MTPETFLTQFGHIADSPNGVRKLRELILDLAVRGRLVPQDTNNEPASELLKRIAAEKSRLLKTKAIRKTKESMKYLDTVPEIPSSWLHTTLYEVGEIGPRNEMPDSMEVSFVPMPLISEFHGVPVQSEVRKWGGIKSGFTHFAEGDVALAKITPCFQNGKSAVMRGLVNGVGAGTTELHIFRSIKHLVYPEYVLVFLKSPSFIQEGIPKMTGSAGQKRITRDYFAGKPFPLPPLEEQKRIVAKVDQLMALCDRLEEQKKRRVEIRGKANGAALDALVNSADSKAFDANWRRIAAHFDRLIDSTETLKSLRTTILDLATSGRLSEKRASAQWNSSYLGECLSFGPTNGLSVKGVEHETKTKVLTLSATTSGKFDRNKFKYLDVEIPSDSSLWLQDGDVLIQRGNALNFVGIAAIYRGNNNEYIYPDLMIKLRPDNSLDTNFLHLILVCPSSRKYFMNNASGTSGSMPKINQAVVKKLIVPIPPLEEQKRIVAKVDELMAVCDRLEAQLAAREAVGEKLASSFTHHLLETA